MKKGELLKVLRRERAQWDALLARIDRSRMTQPGVAGEWSVKDVIAHISWHEREMIGVVRARALVGSELWNLAADERNAAIFEANQDRALDDVLVEAEQVFGELVAALEAWPGEDLSDPARFQDMPEDWMPWKLIAENSFEHYQQHEPDVRAWLEAAKHETHA